jgi:hypothetical protein
MKWEKNESCYDLCDDDGSLIASVQQGKVGWIYTIIDYQIVGCTDKLESAKLAVLDIIHFKKQEVRR